MIVRLRVWLLSRPLAAQAALAMALLAAAVVWAAWPGSSAVPHPDPASRPVLSPDTGPADSTAQAGSDQESQSGPVEAPAAPEAAATATPFLLPHQEPQPAESGLSWTTAVRTVLSLAAVLALIFVCARLLYAFVSAAAPPSPAGRMLRVLETTYLPAPSGRGRSAVSLVEFGERLLLIGATDAQLTLLAEIDPDELPDPYRRQLHRAEGDDQEAMPAGPATHDLGPEAAALEPPLAGRPAATRRRRPARGAPMERPDGAFAAALAAVALDGQGGARSRTIAEESRSQDELAELLQRLRESARRIESGG